MSDLIKQCRDVKKLSAQAQKAYALFMEECERQKLNVLIVETLRTKERQYFLACQGRTVPQAKAMGVPATFAEKYANPSEKQVTWTLDSNHLGGMAFDFCKNVKGQEYSDKAFFNKCGEIVSDLGLEWGGAFGDSPHVQVPKGWKEPIIKEDEELKKAVTKIIDSGVKINDASWNRLDRINLKNVPALISKIGVRLLDVSTYDTAVAKMVEVKIINSPDIWKNKKYTEQNVRDLIVKVSGYLG